MISQLKTERGLALQDLLIGAYEYIEGIDFPPAARVYLLDHLATTEYDFFLCPYSIPSLVELMLNHVWLWWRWW